MSGDLSLHFHLHEFLRSGTAARLGIDMTPPAEVVSSLRALCHAVLEPLRQQLAAPIAITSGYRPPRLNAAIGGARNSQHMIGEAADIIVVGMTPREVWRRICDSDLPYDQVIEEYNSWTHVSHHVGHNRRQALLATRVHGRTRYQRSAP